MKEIIIATKNQGKVKEFHKIFQSYDIVLKSLHDLSDSLPDIEETGDTFQENAQLKAEQVCAFTKMPVIADDSGLVVDALNGRPGVYSARYAGVHGNDVENYEKVLEEMKSIPKEKRSARFVCALTFARPNHPTVIKIGYCEGTIAFEPKGQEGFGYDPIFIPKGFTKTMAQLTPEQKNKISHRYKAIEKFTNWLKKTN